MNKIIIIENNFPDKEVNEKEWKKFQERVKKVNKFRDLLGVFFAVAEIRVKIKETPKGEELLVKKE